MLTQEPIIGIVYILTNDAMPGLIKIGFSNQEDVKTRMAQLYRGSAGVPLPFDCVYAAKVSNAQKVEKALHMAFNPDRINLGREFFDIDPSQAVAIIKLLEIEDVTPKVIKEKEQLEEADLAAAKEYKRKKRPRLNFEEMGIPSGSLLVCNVNNETAEVLDARNIRFRNEITSLTNATKVILENAYQVAPGPYWSYNGKRLRDIYNETYLKEID